MENKRNEKTLKVVDNREARTIAAAIARLVESVGGTLDIHVLEKFS